MVRAWLMDDDVESDQRLEHHRNPPEFVDLQTLFRTTGVEYFKVRQHCSVRKLNYSALENSIEMRWEGGGKMQTTQNKFQ
jgi:hypothetical protein